MIVGPYNLPNSAVIGEEEIEIIETAEGTLGDIQLSEPNNTQRYGIYKRTNRRNCS